MSVSYFDERLDTYVVFQIKDNGSPGRKDTFTYGTTDTAADATSWVNLGTDTSGHDLTPLLTAQVSNGNDNVTA